MRKFICRYCDFEGKPIKGTAGRIKHSGMTVLCPSCRGIVE